MSARTPFTKESLDACLKELAKEFRKRNGTAMKVEIILIGGAAILANYGFREMTYDMDAIMIASSAMKEAINHVGDRLGLPNGWLNTDFIRTKSYTPKLIEFSVHYRMYSNILTIRTITAEHLVAMKLMSGRKYKNDLSDIIGILREHQKANKPIAREAVDKAVTALYGGWDAIPAESIAFINSAYENLDFDALFRQVRKSEVASKDTLLAFEREYPNAAKEGNIGEILERAKQRRSRIREEPKR